MHRFIQYSAPCSLKRIFCAFMLAFLVVPAMMTTLSCDDTEVEDVDDSDDVDDDTDGGDEVICGATFNENIKPFLESYCLRCHSAQVSAGNRNGAPESSNFDMQQEVLADGESIRTRLLDGGGMPPTPPEPSHIERDDVISWIDCALNQQGS